MPAVLDHVFILTGVGAPAADRLRNFGLLEGTPNRHPGQGTACRRFFFRNAMLELIWVHHPDEARSDQARKLQLAERSSAAGRGASPFGIILRPAPGETPACPFPSWKYQPASMPDLSLHVAQANRPEEPLWCFLEAGRAPAEAPPERRQPLEHPAGLREITAIRLVCPALDEASLTVAMARAGVIGVSPANEHLLNLTFDGGHQNETLDFRPDLPLRFHW